MTPNRRPMDADPVTYHERISIGGASELARVSLERSRDRYRDRRRRERRRSRVAAAVVAVLGATVVYLGAGGSAWPH